MNVSVSPHLLEKGREDAIFGSLKEDRAKGDCGGGMCDSDNRDGIGSGREPNGHGGE